MRLEQVEVPIEIVVPDTDAHARLLGAVFADRAATLESFLSECAVMVVAEQKTGTGIAGEIDVRPSIVVEISHHRAQAVAVGGGGNARPLTHIGEGPITVVAVEGMPALWQPSRAAHDRNALPGADG